MAVYLGDKMVAFDIMHLVQEGEEVNTIVAPPDGTVLNSLEISELQDAVAYRTGQYQKKNISNMIYDLNKPYFINRNQTIEVQGGKPGEWTRPADWPDLDSLNLQMKGDDFIYEVFDIRDSSKIIAQRIITEGAVSSTVEWGYIEDGEFHTVYSTTVSSGGYYSFWANEYHTELHHEKIVDYAVVRITGPITYCVFANWSINQEGDYRYYTTNQQAALVERIAWVPHLRAFMGNSNYLWGAYTLEHEVVANGDGTALTSLASAWSGCYRLQKLDVSGLYTPNVTTLSSTFNQCINLKELDLHHWDTSKVTTFASTFYNCQALRTLNINGWTSSLVTNMSSMFYYCRSLMNLDAIQNWDTSKVTNFATMFSSCANLKRIPVNNFNVSKTTSLNSMFSGCYSLEELDLSNWRPSLVTNLASFLYDCWSLKRVNFNGWTTGTLTTISSIFYSCRSLQALDISWLHVTNACTTIYCAFSNMQQIKKLNIPNDWDLSGITGTGNVATSVFSGCSSLETITGISNWNFTGSIAINSIFSGCWNLKTVDVSNWTVNNATNLSNMFNSCYALENIDLHNWQSENSTSFASMFQSCFNLKSIGNIDHWDTSKSTTFASMFTDCWSLVELPDITKWDFSLATTLASMFNGCLSVVEINFPNLNLPNVTTIATMFRYCRNLRKVDISGWNIPKLNTAPAQIFGDCFNLREVNVFPIPLNHSYNGCYLLNKNSILNILNSLPTVTSSKTLNLMTQNINQLQAADKAIATDKGWTLAN